MLHSARYLILTLSAIFALSTAFADDRDHRAPLGDGRGLAVWFSGLGSQLVTALTDGAHAAAPWRKAFDVEKLKGALKTHVTVVDQNDLVNVRNEFGEMKEGRVIFRGETPRIYIDRYVWTHLFESNHPNFRTVLHLYLYAAGYDDRHYSFSSRVPASAFPVSAPDEDRPVRSALWSDDFLRRPETLRLANGDTVVIRMHNPPVGFTADHYRWHPAYMQANSIERYDSDLLLKWIYFPKEFPVRKDYEMNQDYISFSVSAMASGPQDGLLAAGVVNVHRNYAYAFLLKLDAQGRTESFLPLLSEGPVERSRLYPLGVPSKVQSNGDQITIETSTKWLAVVSGNDVTLVKPPKGNP